MAEAEVGDDVLGDDPTVELLQRTVAERFEQEAALLVPTGTMGNQIAVKALTQPGDEIVCEAISHVFVNEAGGLGLISGVQACALRGAGGRLSLEQIRGAIRSEDVHHPRTTLIVLENTHNYAGGRILPLSYLKEVRALAKAQGIRVHLDGARLFNASVASGVPVADFAREVDSLMFCLTKGLACPVGSMIVGSGATIERCRKLRKALGGGMHQAGILAAAGLFALDHLVDRLAEDHSRARRLAAAIGRLPGCRIDLEEVETNIVMVHRPGADAIDLERALRERGILTFAVSAEKLRLVTHRDILEEDVDRAVQAFVRICGG